MCTHRVGSGPLGPLISLGIRGFFCGFLMVSDGCDCDDSVVVEARCGCGGDVCSVSGASDGDTSSGVCDLEQSNRFTVTN